MDWLMLGVGVVAGGGLMRWFDDGNIRDAHKSRSIALNAAEYHNKRANDAEKRERDHARTCRRIERIKGKRGYVPGAEA